MSYIHIIIMIEVVIAVLTFIMITSIHNNKKEIREGEIFKLDEDIFTAFYNKKKRDLLKAGSLMSVNTYIKLMIGAPILLCVLSFFLSQNVVFSILLMIFGFFVPDVILRFLQSKADSQFEEMYAKALEQLASSLRAGRNIKGAVEDVVNCKFLHPSMKARFAGIAADLDMGISIEDAFNRFASNTTNQDAKDVALAITVQNKTGGHEAEVIQSYAEDIRERIMMRKEIKTLFATTNITVKFMNFLCPIMILFVCLFMPEMVSTYFSSPSMLMVFICILIVPFVGMFVTRKMLSKFKQG